MLRSVCMLVLQAVLVATLPAKDDVGRRDVYEDAKTKREPHKYDTGLNLNYNGDSGATIGNVGTQVNTYAAGGAGFPQIRYDGQDIPNPNYKAGGDNLQFGDYSYAPPYPFDQARNNMNNYYSETPDYNQNDKANYGRKADQQYRDNANPKTPRVVPTKKGIDLSYVYGGQRTNNPTPRSNREQYPPRGQNPYNFDQVLPVNTQYLPQRTDYQQPYPVNRGRTLPGNRDPRNGYVYSNRLPVNVPPYTGDPQNYSELLNYLEYIRRYISTSAGGDNRGNTGRYIPRTSSGNSGVAYPYPSLPNPNSNRDAGRPPINAQPYPYPVYPTPTANPNPQQTYPYPAYPRPTANPNGERPNYPYPTMRNPNYPTNNPPRDSRIPQVNPYPTVDGTRKPRYLYPNSNNPVRGTQGNSNSNEDQRRPPNSGTPPYPGVKIPEIDIEKYFNANPPGGQPRNNQDNIYGGPSNTNNLQPGNQDRQPPYVPKPQPGPGQYVPQSPRYPQPQPRPNEPYPQPHPRPGQPTDGQTLYPKTRPSPPQLQGDRQTPYPSPRPGQPGGGQPPYPSPRPGQPSGRQPPYPQPQPQSRPGPQDGRQPPYPQPQPQLRPGPHDNRQPPYPQPQPRPGPQDNRQPPYQQPQPRPGPQDNRQPPYSQPQPRPGSQDNRQPPYSQPQPRPGPQGSRQPPYPQPQPPRNGQNKPDGISSGQPLTNDQILQLFGQAAGQGGNNPVGNGGRIVNSGGNSQGSGIQGRTLLDLNGKVVPKELLEQVNRITSGVPQNPSG